MAIAFFGVVLLAIIAYAGWSANQTATERESMLVENSLNQSIARALNEQKSVAWWETPSSRSRTRPSISNSPTPNFGIFLTETYGHDEVYILNAEDRPLYRISNAKTARAQPLSRSAARPWRP